MLGAPQIIKSVQGHVVKLKKKVAMSRVFPGERGEEGIERNSGPRFSGLERSA